MNMMSKMMMGSNGDIETGDGMMQMMGGNMSRMPFKMGVLAMPLMCSTPGDIISGQFEADVNTEGNETQNMTMNEMIQQMMMAGNGSNGMNSNMTMNEMIQQMMMAGNGSNGMNSNSTEADPQELENAMNMNNMTASEAELEARIAFLPFIGVALGVYLFSKISMAHFNPAVTLGFLITKQITRLQLLYYFTAEILGALLGSLFVMAAIERENDLGANSPNYAFPRPTIFGIEVLASALLMAIILVVVYTKGLRG
jgi:glycerol uptake facilitator-like aquaporin